LLSYQRQIASFLDLFQFEPSITLAGFRRESITNKFIALLSLEGRNPAAGHMARCL